MKEIHTKLGEVLKLERERRKIAIEDASDQLKISQSNLEYVESGDIDNAPSSLYFGMFAKSYAEFLGIDYTATLDAIKDELGLAEVDFRNQTSGSKSSGLGPEKPAADNQPGDASNISKKLLSWFGIFVFGFICVLLVWIFVFDNGDDLETTNSDNQASDNLIEQPINNNEQTNDQEVQPVHYEFGTPPSEPADPIQFRMIANGESWATILADGDTAIFRNLIVGRQYEVEANYRLRISIANPGVVQTFVNNTEVDLRNPETRRVSRVVINQVNLSETLSPREVVTAPPINQTIPIADSIIVTSDTTALSPAPMTNPSADRTTSPADTINQDSTGGL